MKYSLSSWGFYTLFSDNFQRFEIAKNANSFAESVIGYIHILCKIVWRQSEFVFFRRINFGWYAFFIANLFYGRVVINMKTTKEYNEIIRKAVVSAIDFQDIIEWHSSYVQNGKIIAPNVPDDSKEITSIQFSILFDINLRDDIVNKIVDIKNDRIAFRELERDTVCYKGRKATDRDTYYYTAKIAVIKR